MRKEGAYLPIRWEYTEGWLDTDPNDGVGPIHSSDTANKLGSDGWELVSPSAAGVGRQGLFKRPYKLCPNCGKKTVFAYASDGGFEPRVTKTCPHCWEWSWEDEALISKEPKGPIPYYPH